MADYIERNALCQAGVRMCQSGIVPTVDNICALIAEAPLADAAPVVHGQWTRARGGLWRTWYSCSVCRRKVVVACRKSKADAAVTRLYPYCHCGAKMQFCTK